MPRLQSISITSAELRLPGAFPCTPIHTPEAQIRKIKSKEKPDPDECGKVFLSSYAADPFCIPSESAEAPCPACKLHDCLIQLFGIEIREERIAEIEFRIGVLPEQKV